MDISGNVLTRFKVCPLCGEGMTNRKKKQGYCGCIESNFKDSNGVIKLPRGFSYKNYADTYRQEILAVARNFEGPRYTAEDYKNRAGVLPAPNPSLDSRI